MSTIFSRILEWHFSVKNAFDGDFNKLIKPMIQGTLRIFHWAENTLLPTPSKSHYLFNLRNFSRVIQGVCPSTPLSVAASADIKQLWVHEVLRVYYDRLVDETDHQIMFEQLRETVKTDFNTDSDKLFANLTDGNEQVTQDHNKSLMYCDFISGNDSKLFMHVPNVDEVRASPRRSS